jgi:hypothetical protein
MTTPSGGTHDAITALAVGAPQRIGRFRYAVAEDAWSWSETFFRILGFEPGQVRPSSSVLATHLAPDGSEQARAAVETSFRTGAPFSFHTVITDAAGSARTVLLAGHGEQQGGVVRTVVGYLVDFTDSNRLSRQVHVEEALAGALDHRAVIEQAKGVLMLAQGIDADEAFLLLRAYSQDSNVKVRVLADKLVDVAATDSEPGEDLLRKVLRIFGAVD